MKSGDQGKFLLIKCLDSGLKWFYRVYVSDYPLQHDIEELKFAYTFMVTFTESHTFNSRHLRESYGQLNFDKINLPNLPMFSTPMFGTVRYIYSF